MSFRLTIVLLVVLVALGAVVFFVDQNPPTPTPSKTTSATVLSFLASDAAELEATTSQGTVLVAKDSAGTWLLKKPEEAPADQPRVENTVSRLSSLTATRTVTAPSDLGEFGLSQPALTATLKLSSGEAKTVLLGDQSPDRSSYYAKLPDGADVYLISAQVGADLTQLVASPPKATPTPTPPPAGTGTPGVESAPAPSAEATPTPAPPAGAVAPASPTPVVLPTPTPVLSAPPATGTPDPDELPPQSPGGTPVIPDLPLPPSAATPTPGG